MRDANLRELVIIIIAALLIASAGYWVIVMR